MKIIGNNPAANNAEITAVASGTLPSGQPVVVNADGTVSVVGINTVTETVGSPVVFESATSDHISAAYDSNAQKVVVVYRDQGNSFYGTAVVGTISGTSLSFGTPVVFSDTNTTYTSICFDENAQKMVIAYAFGSSGRAIVGTVSGTSISFGSPASLGTNAQDLSIVYDSSAQKVVVSLKNSNDNYGNATVGTVSGTSISFGTLVVFASHAIYETKIAYDSTNNKVVIAYTNASQQGTAIVGTVSGTSISFGSAVVFDAGEIAFLDVAYDVASGKSVIVYMKGPGGNQGANAIVGTISGTSISFGTAVVYDSGSGNENNTIVYHEAAEKVIVVYWDNSNSDRATALTGTVSGTTISFENPVVLEQGASSYISPAYDSTNKVVFVALMDGGNSNYGTGVVYQPTYSSANLTSENYIGMSGGVVKVIDSQEESLGSQTAVYTGAVGPSSIVYDTGQNKLLIVYKGISDYGTAVVGTVSGSSISFGTPVVFISSTTNYPSATFDPNAGKTGIFWADYGQSQYGKACVATISGTSVSFGSTVTFSATTTGGQKDSTFYASQNKILLAYRESSTSSKIRAATISGTSISFGSAVNIGPSQVTNLMAVGYDTNAGKALLAYQNRDNNRYIDSKVVTLSGTTVSLGSQVSVYADGAADTVSMTYDSTNNKMVIAYRHDTGDLLLRLIAGSISGTSVSYGTAVSTGVQFMGSPSQNFIHFNAAAGKIVYAGRDDANSYHQKYVTATVSGTDISVETPVTYYAATSYTNSSAYDPDQEKSVLFYASSSFSNPAVKILTVGYENITRGSVADGDKATIDIGCAISTNQLGLTAGQTYYVQTDGTIGLTPADPSVIAGTAISATEIIVKG